MLAERNEPLGAPRRQTVAVLFVDIVGFTRVAERMPPEAVASNASAVTHGPRQHHRPFDLGSCRHSIHSTVFLAPVLDGQLGIAVEAVVIGADLRFDPARFVPRQQMYGRRRFG
jgi:hypothetical protein